MARSAIVDKIEARPAMHQLARAALVLTGLGLALTLRLDIAGAQGAEYLGSETRPVVAGLVFAVALLAVAVAANPSALNNRKQGVPSGLVANLDGTVWAAVAWGLVGATVLAAFPLVLRLNGTTIGLPFPAGDFPLWAAVVSLVAVAEEVLLRGVLFRALNEALGVAAAVGLTTIAFALLHVPLYGPGVLPLDLAVGLWLGALRVVSGSVVAPATAHALADIAAWWLA